MKAEIISVNRLILRPENCAERIIMQQWKLNTSVNTWTTRDGEIEAVTIELNVPRETPGESTFAMLAENAALKRENTGLRRTLKLD